MLTFLFSLLINTPTVAAPTVDLDDERETYCENYQESADTLDVQLPKICLAKGN
jgi:hypothetical protein